MTQLIVDAINNLSNNGLNDDNNTGIKGSRNHNPISFISCVQANHTSITINKFILIVMVKKPFTT